MHGRSDSTLNRHGIRMGSADIYQAVERLPEIAEALVIGAEQPDGGYWMPLFVVLADDAELTDELRDRIKRTIREEVSPRHVPDEIIVAPAVPHTRTGKKLEVPIKKLLQGADPARVVEKQRRRRPCAARLVREPEALAQPGSPMRRTASSMSLVGPANDSRTNEPPRTVSKSIPGAIATPVSANSFEQNDSESVVRCGDVGVDVERAVGRGEPVDADRAQPVEQQLPVGRVVMQIARPPRRPTPA